MKSRFTHDEQQMFVASFYGFLKYDQEKDFVVDFDDVWKWCGFLKKGNAKKILTKHFTVDTDYKVKRVAAEVSAAASPNWKSWWKWFKQRNHHAYRSHIQKVLYEGVHKKSGQRSRLLFENRTCVV